MPESKIKNVKSLHLDLRNFRTIRQSNELSAINAIISINPDWFWALLESLLEDGYHPTENIIVQLDGGKHVVKEGNRRIAALKIILGHVEGIDIPDSISAQIAKISDSWKTDNCKVPCAIYSTSDSPIVDKIVSITHAKGEKAGRDKWNAVARARYGRDQKNISEPGLDLLEKYLGNGKNLSPQQAERWAGDYPLTVLDEAVQKLSSLIDLKSTIELVEQYPKKNKKLLDKILYDIGIAHLGFKELRDSSVFWSTAYGLIPVVNTGSTPGMQPALHSSAKSMVGPTGAHLPGARTSPSSSSAAFASNDPKSVRRKLRELKVKGTGREKLVTLLNEIKTLRHENHPHAFCLLLRSMFELSAKAYCKDHRSTGGPDMVNAKGEDRHLVDILRDITKDLTNGGKNKERTKQLHGAITELAKKEGLLSVTSMNQLIHNPSFSISPSDISLLFGNVYTLLEEMNR